MHEYPIAQLMVTAAKIAIEEELEKIVVHDVDPTDPTEPRRATLLEFDPAQAMVLKVVAQILWRSALSGDPEGLLALESIAEVKSQLLDIHTQQVRTLKSDLELIERARIR
jgi:hypothetical protein